MTPPMTNDLIDLIERLREEAIDPYAPGLRHVSYVNPDGPEAAAHIEALAERVRELEGALERARDAVEGWAAYADPYFHEKHGLADDLAAIDTVLARQARKDKENG